MLAGLGRVNEGSVVHVVVVAVGWYIEVLREHS